jgi:hypothetical protein
MKNMPDELDDSGCARKINLVDIVTRTDFLNELFKAARMSRTKNKEAGFAVYTNDNFSEISVNRSILGKAEKLKEWHLIQESLPSEFDTDSNLKQGYGLYIPVDHYTLLALHFHTQAGRLAPSGGDIEAILCTRRLNVTLRNYDEHKREVYKDKEKLNINGYAVDYANPVAAVCVVKKLPKDIDIIFYQGITRKPIDSGKFFKFAAWYYGKLKGKRACRFDDDFFRTFGFFNLFKYTKRALEFLNASKYLRAVDLKIRNGKIKANDLKKLKDFELIQTRFYDEDEYNANRFDPDDLTPDDE